MSYAILAAAILLQAPAPADQVKASVEKMRALKSYSVGFKGDFRIPNSDPMILDGETVWVTPGVLFLRYKASGGDDVRLVRAGAKVWMYHLQVEDWVPAEEAGRGGAGKGLQNPDEVMSLLLKIAVKAKAAPAEAVGGVACTAIDINLEGEEMGSLLKEQGNSGNFDWKKSGGKIHLCIDAANLLRKLTIDAELTSTDPKINGKINYKAEVTMKNLETQFGMAFTMFDPKTKKDLPLPISEEILNEIEKTNNIPAELKAEVAKHRTALQAPPK